MCLKNRRDLYFFSKHLIKRFEILKEGNVIPLKLLHFLDCMETHLAPVLKIARRWNVERAYCGFVGVHRSLDSKEEQD